MGRRRTRRAGYGYVVLAVLRLVALPSNVSAQPAPQALPPPNSSPATSGARNVVALDFAGRGGIAAVVYERDVHPHLALGIGFGSGWGIEENEPGLVPLYLSSGLGGVKHRLHVGAGVSLVHVRESYRTYASGWNPRIGWSPYPNADVGYEYRGQSHVWRLTIHVSHQPLGVPGGVLPPRESGTFTTGTLLYGWRF